MTGDRRPDAAVARWGLVATVLRGGTIVAVMAIGLGLAWALVAGTVAPEKRTVVELLGGGGPDALIAIGLLALTLVPIASLVGVAWVLGRSGERRTVVVTCAVLLLLLASLLAAATIGARP
jgi:hypothetical protein